MRTPGAEPDSADALAVAVDLLNAAERPTATQLREALRQHGYLVARLSAAQTATAWQVAHRVLPLFSSDDTPSAVSVTNDLLDAAAYRPRLKLSAEGSNAWALTMHDSAALSRWRTDLALQAARLIVAGDLRRLKQCAASDCDAVFVDRSRPRSRKYCSPDGCGNRSSVRAYRARARSAPGS